MSYAIDANVLVYASAPGSPYFRRASEFLDACRRGPELLCLAWPTVMGYLRLVTHPAVLSPPLELEAALQNIETLLRLPHVRILSEMDGLVDVFRVVVQGLIVRGNLVPDAHLTAILIQHGVDTLYTNDRDFHRFGSLRVKDPFEVSPR